MRAIVITQAGGPEVLEMLERPVPKLSASQVRVRVAAVGLNRADVLQRRGLYPAPAGFPPDIPGLEFAGVVEQVGDGDGGPSGEQADEPYGRPTTRFQPGDRVMGITGGGAFAEELVLPANELLPVPEHLSLEQAAAIPEAFVTAFDALCLQADVQALEALLIHAVGSGVGLAALQLARAHGLHTLGTSRTPHKLELAGAFGLEHGILVQDGQFARACRDATGGRGVDVVLDFMGAGYLSQNVQALAQRGRLIVLGLMQGVSAELPLGVLLAKRLCVRGSTLRGRAPAEKAQLAQRFCEEVLPLFDQRLLEPVVHQVLPMEQVAEAHRMLENNQNFGKLILTWGTRL